MIAPLLAIVFFAIVGIPQFAPVVASPVGDEELIVDGVADLNTEPAPALGAESKAGTAGHTSEAPAFKPNPPHRPHTPRRHGAEDLFAPYPDQDSGAEQTAEEDSAPPRRRRATSAAFEESSVDESWQGDPSDPREFANEPPRRRRARNWAPPQGALDGWEVAGKGDVQPHQEPEETRVADSGQGLRAPRKRPRELEQLLERDEPSDTSASPPEGILEAPAFDPSSVGREEPEESQPAPPPARKRRRSRGEEIFEFTQSNGTSAEEEVPEEQSPEPSLAESRFDDTANSFDEQFAQADPPPRTRSRKRVRSSDAELEMLSASATGEAASEEGDTLRPAAPRAQRNVAPEALESTEDNQPPQPANRGDVDSPAGDPEKFTWEMAARRLKELGVKKYRFKRLDGEDGFIFSCSLVGPGDSRVERRFEAEAEEQLPAVQKVIRQIEDWQARR